jgi:hypothetical protein
MNETLTAALAMRVDDRTFGELTATEVAERAAGLSGATGFGHRSRVGAVAAAWRGLAELMEARGAATVADLDASDLEPLIEPLWIVPPGGSLLP